MVDVIVNSRNSALPCPHCRGDGMCSFGVVRTGSGKAWVECSKCGKGIEEDFYNALGLAVGFENKPVMPPVCAVCGGTGYIFPK